MLCYAPKQQLSNQNNSCNAFHSCWLFWLDRFNVLCANSRAVMPFQLLALTVLCYTILYYAYYKVQWATSVYYDRIIWFLLWSKNRWDPAHCRSKTGLLQSWCGLGCWLVQPPFECKLQKPIAKGLTWTFFSLDSTTNFCLKIIQLCAEAGTCAHVNVLVAYLASHPGYNSILQHALDMISFTAA